MGLGSCGLLATACTERDPIVAARAMVANAFTCCLLCHVSVECVLRPQGRPWSPVGSSVLPINAPSIAWRPRHNCGQTRRRIVDKAKMLSPGSSNNGNGDRI